MKRRDFFKFAAAPALAPIVIRAALAKPLVAANAVPTSRPPLEIRATLFDQYGGVVVSDVFPCELVGTPCTYFALRATKPVTFKAVTGSAIVSAGIEWGKKSYPISIVRTIPCGGDITLQFQDGIVAVG